jgi:nascent polypeptide-associated complex subunit alpha
MAYKAYKAVKGAPQGRDAKRMMQKMGMKIDEIDGVTEVLIRTATREIVIEAPVVTSVVVQGQRMYQITGGSTHERTPSAEAMSPEVPEEDAKLVAAQTGKTVDEAKAALKESGGNLAEAILKLKQKDQA